MPFLVHLGHLMEYASLIAPLSVIFRNEKETNAAQHQPEQRSSQLE